ncbi:hypothetical protein RvY_05332 [Ramazzottius varieornatus]|uniref:THAP4-like heme-binding domain-containing protein n=1 Tax=Ramazzottius varieornatus TaxID=947166 RepID=A0A1D1UXR4_RAMVA|nr:hypothetical protein RvY_05332 [Ramazzottius varieornatus]
MDHNGTSRQHGSNGHANGMSADAMATPHLKPEEKTARRHSLLYGHADGTATEPEAPIKHAPVHPHYLPKELEPLSWIAGKWSVHEPGILQYPTIKTSKYAEEIEFVFSGQKMLDYKAESWNPVKGRSALMHREVGFLRINNKQQPASGEGDSFAKEYEVALIIAHSFGVAEVLTGSVSPNKLIVTTSTIGRMPFAAEPPAVKTRRVFTFNPEAEELEHVLELETTETKLQEHLRIKYKRVTHAVADGHAHGHLHNG